jgi:hypothetical protein
MKKMASKIDFKELFISFILGIAVLGLGSCEKRFLDEKPDKKLVVPQTVSDAQALLDNDILYNYTPYLGEIASGDFSVEYVRWTALPVIDRNAYIWARDIYEANQTNEWSFMYRKIYYANTALETIGKIVPSGGDLVAYNNVKGNGLFYRAWSLYSLAQMFCRTYDPTSSDVDLGLPIRLETDLNVKTVRATVSQTYQAILSDLKTAVPLLPGVPLVKTRASKSSAFGLLAKTCLVMGDYAGAKRYADSCLFINGELLDFNTLNASSSFPVPLYNKEVIFHQQMQNSSIFLSSRLVVDNDLHASYEAEDLRKVIYYFQNAGKNTYKGSYNGSSACFGGIAADEVYLIRAEANVRLGDVQDALKDLNKLLFNRYKKGAFQDLVVVDAEVLLKRVLLERRKELVYRGIRWSDLRRLNLDPRFAVTLTRNLNGEVYILAPNSPRYVFPIPADVISLSGIGQNER